MLDGSDGGLFSVVVIFEKVGEQRFKNFASVAV